MSSSFNITLAPGVLNVTAEEVRRSALFTQWVNRLEEEGMILSGVYVCDVLKWGKPEEPKMIYLLAEACDADGRKLHRTAVHLRGDTVDVLAILRCEGKEYVVFVAQPRVPGAKNHNVSNPSGMVDAGEEVTFAGLRELDEELGYKIEWEKPFHLVDRPLLVSAGGTGERAHMLCVRANVSRDQISMLHNRFGGVADEGEKTRVLVVPFAQAMEMTDGTKTMLSLLLYQTRSSNVSGFIKRMWAKLMRRNNQAM
jgi:8-oxo-dGTP pyrophosphatase MutT (NUDIX family)